MLRKLTYPNLYKEGVKMTTTEIKGYLNIGFFTGHSG